MKSLVWIAGRILQMREGHEPVWKPLGDGIYNTPQQALAVCRERNDFISQVEVDLDEGIRNVVRAAAQSQWDMHDQPHREMETA